MGHSARDSGIFRDSAVSKTLGAFWVMWGGLNYLNISLQEQEGLVQSEGFPCFMFFLEGYAPGYEQNGSSHN